MYQDLYIYLLFASLCSQCSAFEFILCTDHHYFIEEETNHLTYKQFGIEGIKECKDYGMISTFEAFWIKLPFLCVTKVSKEGLESVMKRCPKIYRDRLLSSIILDNRPRFALKIDPGTEWCGAGNISRSETDLGTLNELDSCCRAHDHCPDSIIVGETKYGITNDKAGSVSKCECDEAFFKCLHDVKHATADNVGFLFGNVLHMPCFKLDYPIVKCIEYGGFLNKQCQVYQLDTTKPKKWQLFDSKIYSASVLRNLF